MAMNLRWSVLHNKGIQEDWTYFKMEILKIEEQTTLLGEQSGKKIGLELEGTFAGTQIKNVVLWPLEEGPENSGRI